MPHANEKTQSERPDSAERGAARAALTQIARPSAKTQWLAALVVGTVLVLYLVASGVLMVRFRSPIPGIASCMLLVIVVLMSNFIGRRRLRKNMSEFVNDGGHERLKDLAVRCLALQGACGDEFRYRIKEFLLALSACGRHNSALRIAPKERDGSLKPFELPFEAQALDEADPNFIQLESLGDVGIGESSPQAPDFVADDATWRRVKRNVVLRGGWLVAGMFLCAALPNAWLSYRRGNINLNLVIYFGLFLLTLFGTTGSWSSRKQWLALPGGLLLRKAKWRGQQWRLYLFQPRDSVLALYRQNKRLWVLFIAQGDLFERTSLTNREADFVLRAWLSPLSPPVEKLTDLV